MSLVYIGVRVKGQRTAKGTYLYVPHLEFVLRRLFRHLLQRCLEFAVVRNIRDVGYQYAATYCVVMKAFECAMHGCCCGRSQMSDSLEDMADDDDDDDKKRQGC